MNKARQSGKNLAQFFILMVVYQDLVADLADISQPSKDALRRPLTRPPAKRFKGEYSTGRGEVVETWVF